MDGIIIPNLGKNVKIIDKEPKGITLQYCLPCESTFDKITFRSKGKCYYAKQFFVEYQHNFEYILLMKYKKCKNEVMMDLAKFKVEKFKNKVESLNYEHCTQLKLF